jgi:hypothetical protein
MKNHVILALTIFLNMYLFAQDNIEKNQQCLLELNDNYIKTYKVIPTTYLDYMIKLNTRTGQMWQIKFDQKKTHQLETPLSMLSLAESESSIDNRFTLIPTTNENHFFLLDQINGKIWQVNWDTRSKKNKISPLNKSSLIETKKFVESRFSLYPTKYSSKFLLIDKITGELWQVIYSMNFEKSEIVGSM